MGHLQPIYPPMGCTQYINPQNEVKLILKENILSVTGDAFDVQIDPQDGQNPYPVFKVDPSFITSKKAFYDMQGNHLFDLRKEHFHLVHKTFKAVDPQGNKFFEVKSGIQRECSSGYRHIYICRGVSPFLSRPRWTVRGNNLQIDSL